MAVTLERFSARYVDIQGDGIFGLFSGQGSTLLAAACGITMKTLVKREVSVRFQKDASTDWELSAGIGIDQGTLLVRRLGLRGTKQNEVWAGKPVNMAAKLSSLAEANEMVVSNRVFDLYEHASRLRQRTLIWSCGCGGGVRGAGLDTPIGHTTSLWEQELAPEDLGLDFANLHKTAFTLVCHARLRVLRYRSYGQTAQHVTMEERIRSHYESLTRVIRFVRATDTKAAPVLGLQIALVGTLAARSDRLLAIIAENPQDVESIVLIAVIVLYSFLLVSVVAFAVLVYVPINPRTGESLIYFEDVAAMDFELFESRAKGMSEDVIESQLLDQIHRVSKIASVKMRRVRWAFLLSAPASALWLVLLAWGTMG